MLTGALLGILHEAAQAVLTLTDDLPTERLATLRLTRGEVVRQLLVIADTSLNLPPTTRDALASIDWQRVFAIRLSDFTMPFVVRALPADGCGTPAAPTAAGKMPASDKS